MSGNLKAFTALMLIGLTGCGAGAESVPMTTVTVTASPNLTPESASPPPSSPSPTKNPEPEPVVQEDHHFPYGIIISNAEQLCTTPLALLPDLVSVGDSPEFVEVIQIVAIDLGYEAGELAIYDDQTVRAVRSIQNYLGVEPDGQVGPITWGALQDQYCPGFVDLYTDNYAAGSGGGNSQPGGNGGGATPATPGPAGGFALPQPNAPSTQPPAVPPPAQGPQPVSLPKIGTCPQGYITNFDTCDPGPSARYAYLRNGMTCDVGYRTDWDYCVLQ